MISTIDFVSLLLPQVLYLWQQEPNYWTLLISFQTLDFIKHQVSNIDNNFVVDVRNWISDTEKGL
jgi:hypothetical protein